MLILFSAITCTLACIRCFFIDRHYRVRFFTYRFTRRLHLSTYGFFNMLFILLHSKLWTFSYLNDFITCTFACIYLFALRSQRSYKHWNYRVGFLYVVFYPIVTIVHLRMLLYCPEFYDSICYVTYPFSLQTLNFFTLATLMFNYFENYPEIEISMKH